MQMMILSSLHNENVILVRAWPSINIYIEYRGPWVRALAKSLDVADRTSDGDCTSVNYFKYSHSMQK